MAYATALAILLVFPMRRENLAGLRLDRHIQRLDPRSSKITHIFLSAAEVKNREEFQWPITGHVADLIELYIKKYRPAIAEPGNPYLFPGPGMVGRSAHELAVGLSTMVYEQIGVPVNVHLMRHFAIAIFLRRRPGAYEIARQILGHKSVDTTVRFYAGLEAETAAKVFGETVLDERADGKIAAAGVFAKNRRKIHSRGRR